MEQNLLEKAKQMFQEVANDMGLVLVSVRYYTGEDGPVLEVLIDKDFSITMEEIQNYTDRVNPLLDAMDDSEEGYVLDISSGGRERLIPFADLGNFLTRWLSVKLRQSGETLLMQLDSFEDGKATFHHFLKGRKKKEVLTEEQAETIHMGYKA